MSRYNFGFLLLVFLIAACTRNLSIIDAVSNNDLKNVRKHISSGLDINLQYENLDSCTLLHIAVKRNNKEMVRLLLENGADVGLKNLHLNLPLHIAGARGHYEIICMLVDAGSKIDDKGFGGWAALHVAAYEGHLDIVNYLVSHKGADLHLRDDGGSTVLHCAAIKGHEKIIKCLFLNDAEINAVDYENLTPLDAAIIGGQEEAQILLRRFGGMTYEELSAHKANLIKA